MRLTVPPLQIGPSFEGAAVGVGLTVTVVVYTVTGAQPDALMLLKRTLTLPRRRALEEAFTLESFMHGLTLPAQEDTA